MSTLNNRKLVTKPLIIFVLFLSTLLLIILFSLQLQNKTALSYRTKAFEFSPLSPISIGINLPTIPPINNNTLIQTPSIVIPTLPSITSIDIPKINTNISLPNIPPINTEFTQIPAVSVPSIPPVNINIPQQIPNIQIPNNIELPKEVPNLNSINSAPIIGSVVSQGASIIQQILASPNAKDIIAMFLGSILSSPKSSSTTTTEESNPESTVEQEQVQPTIVSEPKIVYQSCKEGENGLTTNVCPARYIEGDKMVYRQCGGSGWCFYTCIKTGTSDVVPCWNGQLYTPINSTLCRDVNQLQSTNMNQRCPSLYTENGKDVFRGCDNRKKTYVWELRDYWCNYTCFKPGTNEVIDCWPGQQKWETPPANVTQSQPTLPLKQNPTTTSTTNGACLANPPSAAGLVGCSTASYTIKNGITTSCSECAGIKAKATCTCPNGTCSCNIPASSPPQTVNCSNNGKLQISLCQ